MSDVSLGNTMKSDRTEGTKKLSVNGSKGTSWEGPLVGRIVRENRVGVLKEGDENKPVVHKEVWDKVGKEHLNNTSLV